MMATIGPPTPGSSPLKLADRLHNMQTLQCPAAG